MSEIQLNPPRNFVAGSTLEFRVWEPDYLAPTWASQFAIVATDVVSTFTGTDYGDGSHLFTIAAAQTANFAAGIYRYHVNLTSGAVRHTVRHGSLEVLHNYAAITGGVDARSYPAKIFDACNDMLLSKATHDQSSLAVGGRSLSRYSPDEIMRLRGYYAHQMTDEERVARGFAPRGVKTVGFRR